MSICANLYVLFRTTPTAERVREIEANIVAMLGYPTMHFFDITIRTVEGMQQLLARPSQ